MLRLCRTLHQVRTVRCYSHGPSVGDVYGSYKILDEHLRRLRPDLVTDKGQIDSMLKAGEVTPTMASIFKKDIDMSDEAKKTAEYWRKMFWYVGLPLTLLCGINTYYIETEHAEHLAHHPHENPSYSHLRIRAKKFFWGDGDHTPFHNPAVNGP